jgi:hypothetical protein
LLNRPAEYLAKLDAAESSAASSDDRSADATLEAGESEPMDLPPILPPRKMDEPAGRAASGETDRDDAKAADGLPPIGEITPADAPQPHPPQHSAGDAPSPIGPPIPASGPAALDNDEESGQ